eukprot:gene11280-13329_t
MRLSSVTECMSTQWILAAAAAAFTLTTYVLGFPLAIFFGMRYLRRYHKVQVPRHEAERHRNLIEQGVWTLRAEEDIITFRSSKSFFSKYGLTEVQPSTRKKRFSIDTVVNLWKAKTQRGESSSPLALNDAIQVQTGTPSQEARDGIPMEMSQLTPRMQTAPSVDMYIPQDMFKACSGTDKASCQSTLEELHATPTWPLMPGFPRSLFMFMMIKLRFPEWLWRQAPLPEIHINFDEDDDGDAGNIGESLIVMKNGQVIKGVHCYLKEDTGDKGIIAMVPVTLLDDPMYAQVAGQFWEDFEDAFYWYQSWEILRRLLQTGFVVLVEMALGPNAALVYAALISGFAALLQQRHSPYKQDNFDKLNLVLLINQFVVQVALIHQQLLQLEDGDTSHVIDVAIIILQVILLSYAIAHIKVFIDKSVIQRTGNRMRNLMSMHLRRKCRELSINTGPNSQLEEVDNSFPFAVHASDASKMYTFGNPMANSLGKETDEDEHDHLSPSPTGMHTGSISDSLADAINLDCNSDVKWKDLELMENDGASMNTVMIDALNLDIMYVSTTQMD